MPELPTPLSILVWVVSVCCSAFGAYITIRAKLGAVDKKLGELQASINENIRDIRLAGEADRKRERESLDLDKRLSLVERDAQDKTHSLDKLESALDRTTREISKGFSEVRERLSKTRTWSQEMQAAPRDSRSELPSDEPPPMRPRLPSVRGR